MLQISTSYEGSCCCQSLIVSGASSRAFACTVSDVRERLLVLVEERKMVRSRWIEVKHCC